MSLFRMSINALIRINPAKPKNEDDRRSDVGNVYWIPVAYQKQLLGLSFFIRAAIIYKRFPPSNASCMKE